MLTYEQNMIYVPESIRELGGDVFTRCLLNLIVSFSVVPPFFPPDCFALLPESGLVISVLDRRTDNLEVGYQQCTGDVGIFVI